MTVSDLEIKAYRSVRSIRFPLRRLTVLTGGNGVGKTNLYRALELLQAAANGTITHAIAREGGLGSVLWAGERGVKDLPRLSLEVGLEADNGSDVILPRYAVEVGFGDSKYEAVFSEEPQIKSESLILPGRRPVTLLERNRAAVWYRDDNGARRQLDDTLLPSETALSSLRGTLPEVDAVRHMLASWRFYHGFRTDPDSPLRQPSLAITSPMLDSDGSNLGAVFATLKHIRGDTVDLDVAIDRAFPGARLDIPPPDKYASFTMTFPEVPHRPFGAAELSDGTLQFLALLGALLSYRPAPFIALNEPEASLHPDLLPALAQAIARASERTQVWVVTHSQALARALEDATGLAPRTVIRRKGSTWLEGLSDMGFFPDDED
ncbi:AAA family ATPase [Devosia sp. MC521]|uniref:AAA family ATPase n=1 Tax=Devosia sp. MC521 TaxID=2759954 RepID=UPI0015FDCA16|nr:AAA family ATPase [Devosia sp. MC521]MBJ6987503.1 AAA family ATPase [Devosia sp. MC521]QMW61863.1 AAA family ATPase [Devosia sp. MC521]